MSQPPVDPGLLAYTFALEAASQGLSGRAFLRSLRGAGMGIRESVGRQLYGLAKRTLAETGASAFSAPGVVPDPATFGATLTRGAEGFLQHVRLVYREQVTGRIVERHYSVKTQSPVTPQEAVDIATDKYSDAADRYRQSLVGAIYTGGTRLVPFEVA